jgi:predicted PhzF superfamily epimerase YddE/YHI9
LVPALRYAACLLESCLMTTRRFLQLDVFSPRAGAGNPLAVVLDAEGLDDASMQAIARWTRLPGDHLRVPPQVAGASYRLRMFSPQKEVPFAGHPSVGTAHAVLQAGLAAPVDGVLCRTALPVRCRCASAVRARSSASPSAPRAQLAEIAEATDPRLQAALKDWPLGTAAGTHAGRPQLVGGAGGR